MEDTQLMKWPLGIGLQKHISKQLERDWGYLRLAWQQVNATCSAAYSCSTRCGQYRRGQRLIKLRRPLRFIYRPKQR